MSEKTASDSAPYITRFLSGTIHAAQQHQGLHPQLGHLPRQRTQQRLPLGGCPVTLVQKGTTKFGLTILRGEPLRPKTEKKGVTELGSTGVSLIGHGFHCQSLGGPSEGNLGTSVFQGVFGFEWGTKCKPAIATPKLEANALAYVPPI